MTRRILDEQWEEAMEELVSTIEIARPPADVYAYATDPLRFSEWQGDVVRVEVLDGERYTTTRRMTGGERTFTQRIVRDEPPSVWAATGVDGPVRPHASITVEPIGEGATSRVTFTLAFEGHGVGVPLLPLVRRQAAKGAPVSYAKLKAILEL
ncbi:MAG: SRPBCC family protein [Hamadaea sp.]|nr:SRPBCC family protein [Hamadaea sp.]